MKYRIQPILALLFIAVNAYAQYDWTSAELHLTNGNTLSGEVKLSRQGIPSIIPGKDRAFYRKNKDAKPKKFYPSKVDHIVFTITFEVEEAGEKVLKSRKATYVPMYLKKKKKRKRFVELMIEGKVSLLGRSVRINGNSAATPIFSHQGTAYMHYHNFGPFSYNEFYVVKKGELPFQINQTSVFQTFRKKASEYFKGCKSLVEKIENKIYKEENLVEIVEYYNKNCN